MTLRQIAQAAHLSLDTINRILKMEKPTINPTTYCALAAGLGLKPEELDACLNEPKPATTLTPEQAAELLNRLPPAAGTDTDQTADVRRQIHAITDLLGFDGLKRLHGLAQQELRQQINLPPNRGGSSGSSTPGSGGTPGIRKAAKPAGPRTHSITRLPTADDLRAQPRAVAPDSGASPNGA